MDPDIRAFRLPVVLSRRAFNRWKDRPVEAADVLEQHDDAITINIHPGFRAWLERAADGAGMTVEDLVAISAADVTGVPLEQREPWKLK